MAEPVTTSTAAGAAGLFGLLVMVFGPLVGGIAVVAIGAAAGVMLATASMDKEPMHQTLVWVLTGVMVALIVSWWMAPVVAAHYPEVDGPHLPGVIGLVVGVAARFSPKLLPALVDKLASFAGRVFGLSVDKEQ